MSIYNLSVIMDLPNLLLFFSTNILSQGYTFIFLFL